MTLSKMMVPCHEMVAETKEKVERSGVHIPHGWRIGGHFWGMWDKWLLEGVLFLPKYVEWHLFLPI